MGVQVARLFEILYILLSERDITAKKLAKHFEISVRTVYRDIETLTFAGIPIYSQRGKKGGIRLLDDYVIDKSLISEKEQKEILYALQSLRATNYPDTEKTLSKLNSIFKKKSDSWIEVEFSRYGEKGNILFEQIKEGILNKKVITFLYYGTKGNKSERCVEPLKLWFKEKAWYLFAYCQEKKDIRQFKVSRIKELSFTGDYFERSTENLEISPKDSLLKEIRILVEIDRSQAYRVYDEFLEEAISEDKNGNFQVVMENYENEWLYGYLLSFGEYLKVREPERIRKILFEKVEKMRKNLI